MNCCGEERVTPFCPMCGKSIQDNDPLLSLLQHCRIHDGNLSKRAQEASSDFNHEHIQKHAAKWKRWVALLEKYVADRGNSNCASGS